MRVISLWQPYASLIFVGVKTYETRGFAFPPKIKGDRIGIHATAKFTPVSMVSPELDALCEVLFGKGYRNSLPRGAILGTVVLKECHSTDVRKSEVSRNDLIAGDWTPDRYAWELEAVEKYPMAVIAKGNQGWWNYNPDLIEIVSSEK